ncbi:unnamed protein product [Arctia plantaginis]|uniref:Uncharacterized protein n=1 Tax=Arctia plantaginis TaxID=874455 RepID=A0A8S0Z330_ARCPL|nr:unnamed protein product [Arctia plantaginis]
MWVIFFTIFYLFKCTDASNNTFVFTPKMAQACKEHICKDGYTYKTIYRVDNEELKEIRKDSDMAFEMHLGIQAMSNGHILLSSTERPGYSDPVYEIVVGGGGNRFTELRRHLKRDGKVSVKTQNILSTFEMRGFYIKISQEGLVEFGKEGEVLPILSYNDVSPLEIKYFSFAAWSGVEAKFLYDCPIPTSGGGEIPASSTEIDQQISMSDRLKRDILLYKLPWIPPSPTMNVRLGIKVTSVKYNAFSSKLVTGISGVISWTDDSMAWYPAKYNGTKRLKFRQGQIWHPKFHVFNSNDQDILEGRNSELITMESSGEATFHFQTRVLTWCYYYGVSKWPSDEYDCSIVIQPWEVHDKITINIMEPYDNKMQIFSDMDATVRNEWETSTNQLVITPTTWDSVYLPNDNLTHQSDRLIIKLSLRRSATPYNIVFYTPLLVLVMFVLLSFWSEPLTMSRVWYFAGCSIIVCMGLCYIDYLIPCHNMPSILVLYTVVLGGVLLALLIQVLLITTTMEKICNSDTMQRVFTGRIFRFIFCLPAYKVLVNGSYIIQEDEEPTSTRGSDVEEMESETQRTYCDKRELAEVIDRVMFIVYSITFAVMLADHF